MTGGASPRRSSSNSSGWLSDGVLGWLLGAVAAAGESISCAGGALGMTGELGTLEITGADGTGGADGICTCASLLSTSDSCGADGGMSNAFHGRVAGGGCAASESIYSGSCCVLSLIHI